MHRNQRRTSNRKGLGSLKKYSESLVQLINVATDVQDSGDYISAEKLWLDLIPNVEKTFGAESQVAAICLVNLAAAYSNTGRDAEAERYYLYSLSIIDKLNDFDLLDKSSALYNLADVYERSSRYDKAEKYFQLSLAIREQSLGPIHLETATSLNGLGKVYESTKSYVEAENFYKRALAIREQLLGLDHPETAISMSGLASVYFFTDRIRESENFFLHALMILENSLDKNLSDVAAILYNLAVIYEKTVRYAEAESFCERSLAIREKMLGSGHPDIINSNYFLAKIFTATARYASAESIFQQTLSIREQQLGLDAPEVADNLDRLAIICDETGRYNEAEQYYRRALSIREKAIEPNHSAIAASLNNLAMVYFEIALYAEAEIYLQRSLEIRLNSSCPDQVNVAHCLHNLAVIFQATNRYVEAENFNLRSLAIKEKLRGADHPDTATTLINLASVYSATNRQAEAEHYYQRALAINEQKLGLDHPETAATLNNLAAFLLKTGRFAEAEQYCQRALKIKEQKFGSDHPSIALCLNTLAQLSAKNKNMDVAILLKKRSINIFQKVRQNVSGIAKEALFSFDKSIADDYDELAEMLINAGRYGEAEFVMGMLKEKEQFELLRRDRQTDIATRTISYNYDEAQLVVRFDELGTSLSALGKQEESLKQVKDRTPKQNQELTEVREQLKKVNREFSEFLDNLHEALPPREVTQIDQDSYKLINMTDSDANTVAVSTVTAEDSFHTIMATRHGRKAFSADHKAVDIGIKVLKFRELLLDREDSAHRDRIALSQELYDIIIRPMEEELLSGGYTTILWMLNGVLRLLPLAALHDGKKFVLEKFRNVCITTNSTIGQQSHVNWNGLGMGVTLKHDGHPALEGVKEELEGIISMDRPTGVIPGDILLDEAFTRDAMESHLKGGYKAVHIASHFELNPANETMSYLLLGDGSKIRMDELRCMPTLFKGVDLVAFSACSTGLGTASTKGRMVDGIGYLGEMQGAKTVMATLWPVEDKSTSMLMREFYRLREAGMTKAEALQQAQLCLLNGKITSEEGHDFTHPYFWAPFILIGNGG